MVSPCQVKIKRGGLHKKDVVNRPRFGCYLQARMLVRSDSSAMQR
jgi:hypothetical protein